MLKKIYGEFARFSKYLQSIALLLARLAVAYGFYEPAMMKWSDIHAVAIGLALWVSLFLHSMPIWLRRRKSQAWYYSLLDFSHASSRFL